jgi:hypothetical protein
MPRAGLRITSEAIMRSDTACGTPNTRFSAPAGKPAPARQSTTIATAAGVSSGGLTMQEQPAASAPAILRAASTM